ncbi:hypothetical protein [Carnobacterium maltaromaticum]|uniref:hypothetical protein n=1 Tax=Carnobacterium maltaromaticum TaxID=2751 RepID=UPI00295E8D09|nr:hypothetical protein [Carnobacterium maltaromaticum]
MENYYNFKKNIVWISLKVLMLSVFFSLIYIIISFSFSTKDAINQNYSNEKDKNLYSLIDTFTDPEKFTEFRESKNSLNELANFYNYLNTNNKVLLVSSFEQPIPISDFKGDITFQTNYGTQLETYGSYKDTESDMDLFDVKSIQMNKNTFNFYNLRIDSGKGIEWENVNYNSDKIPVILGNKYENIYQLGDVIQGDFYSKKMDFEVIGFLEKNSSLFYKNEINHFIDNYLIIPYPNSIGMPTDQNQYFSGILYFAMLNGDIVADKNMSNTKIIDELTKISDKSNFYDYTLIGLPTYLTQFNLIRNTIVKNLNLIYYMALLLLFVISTINIVINKELLNRRFPKYFYMNILGESSKKIKRRVITDVFIETTSIMLLFFILFSILPNKEQNSLSLAFVFMSVYLVIDLVSVYLLFLVKKLDLTTFKEEHFD